MVRILQHGATVLLKPVAECVSRSALCWITTKLLLSFHLSRKKKIKYVLRYCDSVSSRSVQCYVRSNLGLPQSPPYLRVLFFLTIESQSRLRNSARGAHRGACFRDFQVLCCAELEAPDPPRTSSAVVRHREGVCAASCLLKKLNLNKKRAQLSSNNP